MDVSLLINAQWVIPVEPSRIVYEDYSIAVDEGRIVAILPTPHARQTFQAHTIVDRPGHVVIPGLVNAHTHSAMSLLRGIADDLPLSTWLNEHIWPAEQQHVSEAFVRDGTLLAMAEMLRGGVSCFNDMYFFPEETAKQTIQCGMRAVIGLILIDFPSAWARNSEEYLTKGLALHDQLRHEPLVTTAFAPHAPYTVSDPSFARIRTFGDELDLPIHTHLHETQHEIQESIENFGVRPLERLRKLNLIGPTLNAVHMTQLDDAEIELLAEAGAHVTHCPESNLKLASGVCPIAKLIAAGINVALGTDSTASNNDLDLLGEARTAALLAKGTSGDAAAIPAYTALQMATLNGAEALGLGDEIGSLVNGKSADITAVCLDQLETRPVYDPISQLIYSAHRSQVSDVWVAGRHLLNQRKLTSLDTKDIRNKTDDWQTRLNTHAEHSRTAESLHRATSAKPKI